MTGKLLQIILTIDDNSLTDTVSSCWHLKPILGTWAILDRYSTAHQTKREMLWANHSCVFHFSKLCLGWTAVLKRLDGSTPTPTGAGKKRELEEKKKWTGREKTVNSKLQARAIKSEQTAPTIVNQLLPCVGILNTELPVGRQLLSPLGGVRERRSANGKQCIGRSNNRLNFPKTAKTMGEKKPVNLRPPWRRSYKSECR